MRIDPRAPIYDALPNQATSTRRVGIRKASKQSNNYNFRPIPLRLPFLLCFVTVTVIYIALIELLLRNAGVSSLHDGGILTSAKKPRQMVARQASASSNRLSTSTVTTTAVVTVSLTSYVTSMTYLTLTPTTWTGTQLLTSTMPISQQNTAAPVPVPTQSSAKAASLVTSGTTSYYVTTVTVTTSVTMVVLKTTVIGQTVMVLTPAQTKSSTRTTVSSYSPPYSTPTPTPTSKASTASLTSNMLTYSPLATTLSSSIQSRPMSTISSVPSVYSQSLQQTSSSRTSTMALFTTPSSSVLSNTPGLSSLSTPRTSISSGLGLTSSPSTAMTSANRGPVHTLSTSMTTKTVTTASATATATDTGPINLKISANERIVSGNFTVAYYIAALYIPALLAILIKGLWEIVFAATRLMQPFERMTTQKGASGRFSLFTQYLSSSLSVDSIRAISHGNPVPLLATLSYVMIQIGTPLVAIAMAVRPRATCEIEETLVYCDPVWIVNVPILRFIEAVLALCFLSIVAILYIRSRRRSGVNSDPSSLGSIATISNNYDLLRSMQTYAIDEQPTLFEQVLRKKRFQLAQHGTYDGRTMYGIVNLRTVLPPKFEDNSTYSGHQYHTVAESAVNSDDQYPATSAESKTFISPSRRALLSDLVGLFTPIALLVLLVVYTVDNNMDGFTLFMGNGTVWPKFILVGLATLSAVFFTNIERTIRANEPFRRLNANVALPARNSRTFAPPATTVHISRSGTAYSSIARSIMLLFKYEFRGGRMLFQVLISLTVVLADLNIVAVAGVAWSHATTLESYQYSLLIGMILTGIMILAWLVIILWWRRNAAVRILRASDAASTVAGTIRYMSCGSTEVVGEIASLYDEYCVSEGRGRHAGEWYGQRAVFGRHVCSDGQERWCMAFQKMPQGVDEIQGMAEWAGGHHY